MAAERTNLPFAADARFPGAYSDYRSEGREAVIRCFDDQRPLFEAMGVLREAPLYDKNRNLNRPTSITTGVERKRNNSRLSIHSAKSRHSYPSHKSAARMLGYALTLGDEASWWEFAAILYARLVAV